MKPKQITGKSEQDYLLKLLAIVLRENVPRFVAPYVTEHTVGKFLPIGEGGRIEALEKWVANHVPTPGAKGDAGERGQRGERGAQGRQGIPGRDGRDGAPGLAGKDGAPGLDGKAGVDGNPGRDGTDGKDGRDGIDGKDGAPGLDGKDGRDGIDGKDGAPGINGKDGRDGIDGKDGAPGLHGSDGKDGASGRDGIDGKDGAPGERGADGFGFDDITVEQRGRTIVIGFIRGIERKEFEITLGHLEYRGVFTKGTTYQRGDVVSWAGNAWHGLRETQAQPTEKSPDWDLLVRKGRDGKNGKDGTNGAPGPQGKPGRDGGTY